MAQHKISHRFGPDIWVTVGSTGEHVRVELWSDIANAYRVHSAGNGVQFFQEAELEEMPPHPDEDFGRHWSRCRGMGCGAPLTAALPVCEKCQARICTCGRCGCSTATARRTKIKKSAKSSSKKEQVKAEPEVVADE
jgi:hypothetical protein